MVGSAKLGINVPELNGMLQYNVFDIAGSYFSSCLIFYVDVMSIMLDVDNSVSRSPF